MSDGELEDSDDFCEVSMSTDEPRTAIQYRDASNLNARIALHERFSTNPRSLPLWIFDQLELPDDARILEIGCGPENLWADNAERLHRHFHGLQARGKKPWIH